MNATNRTCTTSRTTPPSRRMRWPLGSIALLGILCFTLVALAPQAHAATPCCGITAIDLRTGLVTARVTATGRTFQFAVTDPALLKTLKVGQAVQADFATMKVSVRLDRLDPCCAIVTPQAPLK